MVSSLMASYEVISSTIFAAQVPSHVSVKSLVQPGSSSVGSPLTRHVPDAYALGAHPSLDPGGKEAVPATGEGVVVPSEPGASVGLGMGAPVGLGAGASVGGLGMGASVGLGTGASVGLETGVTSPPESMQPEQLGPFTGILQYSLPPLTVRLPPPSTRGT